MSSNNIFIAQIGDCWLSSDSIDTVGYYKSQNKALKAIEANLRTSGFDIIYLNPDMTQGEYGKWDKTRENPEQFGCFNIQVECFA
ncbi:hypothetical protein [Campylobacter sp. RM16188]|uniref:hypothetical protein n=1 Tax=Campylobacter sp. RM16188 TaxID=1705725 RepID=UPI0015579223|nr:hypothetical protein [Campylobacter sp. RM16188]